MQEERISVRRIGNGFIIKDLDRDSEFFVQTEEEIIENIRKHFKAYLQS